MEISWNDFEKIEMRIGTILKVKDFPEARKPAYIITVDFGESIGIKKSSAQITDLYTKDELFNKQITYLRDKNAKLLIRNQHLERKLHEQANNAGRRSSSRSKTIPTKEKVCKVFRIY